MSQEIKIAFPAHKVCLPLERNTHKVYYQTAAQAIEQDPKHYCFQTDEEKAKAIATDEIWALNWYPNTPVGSYTIHAASVEALMDYANGEDFSK